MIVTTGNDLAGYDITDYLGVVRGIIVRATGLGPGIAGGIRAIGGGNIPEYAAVCETAREHAFALMVQHAQQLGAHGVIAMRYDATDFIEGITEVLAYGTAVKIVRRDGYPAPTVPPAPVPPPITPAPPSGSA